MKELRWLSEEKVRNKYTGVILICTKYHWWTTAFRVQIRQTKVVDIQRKQNIKVRSGAVKFGCAVTQSGAELVSWVVT
jgi:hypothetical protein